MPTMIGLSPIRRTVQYLKNCNLVLKDRVRVFCINYNVTGEPHHQGARDFVYWTLPQLQYKNPTVQVVTLKNMTPSPFITCFLEDGKSVLVDVDNKSRLEIQKHLKKVLCKTDEQLKQLEVLQQKKENPANFGFGCEKNCMCIIPGQVPCPGVVELPYHMRGRFLIQQKLEDDLAKKYQLEDEMEQS